MNRIPYKIFENFSNIKEKECVEADKHNETLYKNTIFSKGVSSLAAPALGSGKTVTPSRLP